MMDGFKVIRQSEDGKKVYIGGYATVENWNGEPVIDDYSTIIKSVSAKEAITEAMNDYVENGSLLFNHNPDIVIGKPINWRLDENGVYLEAVLSEPITDEERSIWTKIKNGVIKGLSIRFGSDYEISKKNVNNEDVYELLIHRIVEISITPTPANPKTLIQEVFERMLTNKTIKKQTKEVKRMDNITISMEEYKEFLKLQAEQEILKRDLNNYKDELTKRETKMKELESKIEKTVDAEEVESLKRSLTEKEEEFNAIKAEKEKLEKELESVKERGINLDISDKIAKNTVLADENDELGRAIKDIMKEDYSKLMAEYIYDNVRATGKDKAIVSPQLVVLHHLEKRGIEVNPEDFHKRTITTDDVMLKAPAKSTQTLTVDTLPSPILDVVPMESINAASFKWRRRVSHNEAKFDSEDAIVEPGDSVYQTVEDKVKYLYVGGKVSDPADRFAAVSALADEIKANRVSLREKTNWALIYGNSEVNSKQIKGMFQSVVDNINAYFYQAITGNVLTFEDIDAFLDLYSELENENGSPQFFAVDPNTYRLIKKLMRDFYKGGSQSEVVISGITYKALDYDGVVFLKVKNLINRKKQGIDFAATAEAGGSLPAGDYTFSTEQVSLKGRSYVGNDITITTDSTNATAKVSINFTKDVNYALIYAELPGADRRVLLRKIVPNTVGDGTVDVIFASDSDFETVEIMPLGLDEGMMFAFTVGSLDGMNLKVAAYEEYVEKGRVGNFREFYLRSYLANIIPSEGTVALMQAKIQ